MVISQNFCQNPELKINILAFYITIGEENERKVYLPYNEDNEWTVLETVMPGNLSTAATVGFRYDDRDIMCIEMLELESLDGSLHFDIIQVCNIFRKFY